jgi:hypothetical protein
MSPSFWALASGFALALVGNVYGALPDGRPHANIMRPPAIPIVPVPADLAVTGRDGKALPPLNTTYYFDQLIDHKNPSLGTFKQRFWFTSQFYQPGGPIVLMTPGEANAQPYTGYLTNRTINGLVAQQQNASLIVLEHRFYGLSNPYPDLSVKSLKYHTLQQGIDDLEHFAKTVVLPMPGGDKVTPDKAPWILIGGSYSGALVSWTMVNKPGLFFSGYSSSGVVQAITDFWRYFEPVRQNMAKNCSADVQAVIERVDRVILSKNATAINALKANWGLEKMTHADDFAGALRNNLWDWQSLQPTSGADTKFRKFCDALEVKDGVSAPASGWGVDHALAAWGAHWRNGYLSTLCGDADAETCLGTYNASSTFYTDESIDNSWRSWNWIVCNEVGYMQDGAPKGHPTLVTRTVGFPYDERQCQFMYPAAFSKPPVINVGPTNAKYKGWRVRLNRLFFANGQRDPWREATVSAQTVNVPDTPQQPIGLSDGFHCSDLSAVTGAADATVNAVQQKFLASIKRWLATEWKPQASSDSFTAGRQTAPLFDGSSAPTSDVESKPVNAWFKGFGHF